MLIEVEMLKYASRYVDNCFDIKDFEHAKDFDSVKLTPTWRQRLIPRTRPKMLTTAWRRRC